MGEWSAFKKCCYCISLTIGSKAIGSFFLLLTLGRTWNIAIVSSNGDSPPGLFIAYLMKIEDVRDFILDDMYGISPCTIAPLETLIDSCFEFSILVNLLVVSQLTAGAIRHCLLCQVFALKKWTRWLLVPWLVMYSINIIVLTILATLMFLYPPNTGHGHQANSQMLRYVLVSSNPSAEYKTRCTFSQAPGISSCQPGSGAGLLLASGEVISIPTITQPCPQYVSSGHISSSWAGRSGILEIPAVR